MNIQNIRFKLFYLLLILLLVPFISSSSPKKNTILGYTHHSQTEIFTNSDFTAPFITDVNHNPLDPTESDVITIGTNVTDASGIYNVTLHYCVNRDLWMNIEMIVSFAFPEIFMVDIGAFTAGDLIQYYITAFDASGNWNEGLNDNGGLYYSFTIIPTVPEFNNFIDLLIKIVLGLIILGYLVLIKKK